MVGDILRREREKQGLTIADIEQGTSIRRLYIGCIEQGKTEDLPESADSRCVKSGSRGYNQSSHR